MNEKSPVDKLSGFEQAFIRSELVNAFKSDRIITGVKIDLQGHFKLCSSEWNNYWCNTKKLSTELGRKLEDLRITRKQYFDSNFSLKFASKYCFQYFILLSQSLEESITNSDKGSRDFLGRVLAFENFKLVWNSGLTGIAAGTTSHRNPVYLLKKLMNFKSPDDPKYLPLVFLDGQDLSHLFYHYRQYRICKDPQISIFLYPAAELVQRGESFTNGLSRKPDPLSKQRAKLILSGAIFPFLKSIYDGNGRRDINFVDIGGGDGLLVRYIWEQLLEEHSIAKKNWFLNSYFVGLRTHNPVRYFSKASIRENLSYFDYQMQDYKQWINDTYCKQIDNYQTDIVLMCRLLNNISNFAIYKTDDEAVAWNIMGKKVSPQILLKRSYKPELCLNPQNYYPKNLGQSNGKTQISVTDSAYRVISLSDYYQAVERYNNMETNNNSIYFPTRQFNEDSLLATKDESILNHLVQISKMVVIEDVDLNIECLKGHIKKYRLDCYASVINNDPKYSSRIFAITSEKYKNHLPGQRIC